MLLLLWHVKSRGSRFPKVAETLFSVESRPWGSLFLCHGQTVFFMISQLCIDSGQLTATSWVIQNQVQDIQILSVPLTARNNTSISLSHADETRV